MTDEEFVSVEDGQREGVKQEQHGSRPSGGKT